MLFLINPINRSHILMMFHRPHDKIAIYHVFDNLSKILNVDTNCLVINYNGNPLSAKDTGLINDLPGNGLGHTWTYVVRDW
jgi:hypothetical protein